MKNKAIICIILSGVFWGTSAIFANLLKSLGFNALHMTAMRGVVAAIVMVMYIFFSDRSLFKVRFTDFLLFVCGGVTTFLSAFFYYESIGAASVSVAVMLMYTSPVIVMAFSVAFFGEKLTVLKSISVFCMLLGCGLISGIFGGVQASLWGVAAGLLAGITYSLYNIVAKIQMDKGCNPLSATVYGFIFMGLIAACVADMPELFSVANQKPLMAYPLIIGIGVFTVALPYFLYTAALKHVPVGTAAALGMVEPMVATILGVLLFNDPISVFSVIGIILILSAVFMLSKSNT